MVLTILSTCTERCVGVVRFKRTLWHRIISSKYPSEVYISQAYTLDFLSHVIIRGGSHFDITFLFTSHFDYGQIFFSFFFFGSFYYRYISGHCFFVFAFLLTCLYISSCFFFCANVLASQSYPEARNFLFHFLFFSYFSSIICVL